MPLGGPVGGSAVGMVRQHFITRQSQMLPCLPELVVVGQSALHIQLAQRQTDEENVIEQQLPWKLQHSQSSRS